MYDSPEGKAGYVLNFDFLPTSEPILEQKLLEKWLQTALDKVAYVFERFLAKLVKRQLCLVVLQVHL